MQSRNLQNAFFLGLLLLTTVAFLWLIRDFLEPVFWAAVLGSLFFPVQRRYVKWLGRRKALAAILTVLTILLIVVLPLFLIGLAVTQESVNLYQRIASGEIDLNAILDFFRRLAPTLVDYMERFGVTQEDITARVSAAAVVVSQSLASRMVEFGQNALRVTLLFFVMLYVLFFFLRDGDRLVDALIRTLPLGDVRERLLFSKFTEVSRATIKGTLVVGAVQGTLGGLALWVLGVTAPIFWGVVMAVFSIIPAVGAGIVWLPAAIILIATGSLVKGIILIAFGTLVISLVDNVLRPILVGKDTKMPDALVLISTLSGITMFGISGFVIGPIIASFFLAVWAMFEHEYGEEDGLVDLNEE